MPRAHSKLANLVVFSTLTILSLDFARAEGTIEGSCRAQAKEVAVQTYQSCVNQARTQRIQEIRKEYQTKLSDLKSTYDQELKSLAGDKKSLADEKVTRKTKPLKGAARGQKLPEKLIPTKKLPIRQVEESNAVVVAPQDISENTQAQGTAQESAEAPYESNFESKVESDGGSNNGSN
jgi:hypothetical protein